MDVLPTDPLTSYVTTIVSAATVGSQVPSFSFQKVGNDHLGARFTSVVESSGSGATDCFVAQPKGFKPFYTGIGRYKAI